MDIRMTLTALLFILVVYSCHSAANAAPYDVMDYGAKGDGETNDAPFFLKAWEKACNGQDKTPTFLVPEGKTFLVYATSFEGPCKHASTINVQISGSIISPTEKKAWEGKCKPLLDFKDIENLIVSGNGEVDGRGKKWWQEELKCKNGPKRPTNLAFHGCKNLQVSNIHSKDSGKNHISINGCQGAVISNVNLTAEADSPNTDGIDISDSENIIIKDSHIGTGDDCIAINNNCHYINITNVACGPGHGISVGSLGEEGEEADVSHVHVQDCSFWGSQNGARIKTWEGGKGSATSITFQRITLDEVENPIIINQHYHDNHNFQKLEKASSSVAISDVQYIDFVGTYTGERAIYFNCSSKPACIGIQMRNVTLKPQGDGKAQVVCENAQGTAELTEPEVTCLEVQKQKGSISRGALL